MVKEPTSVAGGTLCLHQEGHNDFFKKGADIDVKDREER